MTYAPNAVDVCITLALLGFAIGMAPFEQRYIARIRAATPESGRRLRLGYYAAVIAGQWVLVGAVVALWLAQQRSWSLLLLGIPTPAWRLAAGSAAPILYLCLALRERHRLLQPECIEKVRAKIQAQESYAVLGPRSPMEFRAWMGVSITAGCCEELLYRGFLLAFLTSFVGLVLAVPLSAVIFGLAHAYQGWRGILTTAVMGMLAAFLVLASGHYCPQSCFTSRLTYSRAKSPTASSANTPAAN